MNSNYIDLREWLSCGRLVTGIAYGGLWLLSGNSGMYHTFWYTATYDSDDINMDANKKDYISQLQSFGNITYGSSTGGLYLLYTTHGLDYLAWHIATYSYQYGIYYYCY